VALRAQLPAVGTSGVETGARGRPIDRPTGSLVLLGDGPPSDLERVAMARIAGLLALELARDEAVRRVRGARGGESLPAAGLPWVVLLARQREVGDADDGPGATSRREATRRELGLLAPPRRLALRGVADSLEVRAILAVDPAGGPDPAGVILAGRIAAFLGRTVAVSRPFSAAAERPAAEAEARATLDAGEPLTDVGPILEAARLPVYRILVGMHHLGDGDRLARSLLEPLLAGRPDVRREHLETLRALLDRGSVGEAATQLGVHRNTVTYRLARIEALTGWRLADPDLRLALSIALRLVRDS
jgi:hypothetical protein